MNVHLTFDVEIWCNGWRHLDREFPAAFERYVYGRSESGEFALPATLDILNRHGLRGIFFVEPLFAARFGAQYLQRIVRMIEAAGQEVQLHLHPEWADEISPPPLAGVVAKRQHLCYYSREEQTLLLEFGLQLLRSEARGRISAFRAGSYAANLDTYEALSTVGLTVDSSLNRAFDISGRDVLQRADAMSACRIGGVTVFPVTVFDDGLARARPAQVGACGLAEMRQVLEDASRKGRQHFVFVSHNFEMLQPGSSEPDRLVVRRFDGLCRYLAAHPSTYDVGSFPCQFQNDREAHVPRASAWATVRRMGEQAMRRWQ